MALAAAGTLDSASIGPRSGDAKLRPLGPEPACPAKYAPLVTAPSDRRAVSPNRPIPELRGPPPPHAPPGPHLRNYLANRAKDAQTPLRLEDAESVHSSSNTSGPGSDFALGAAGKGEARQLPDESHLEAPGLRLLRMSSLHALGSRARGSSGSAAADAARLVPGPSASAAASAAAAASALRSAGD